MLALAAAPRPLDLTRWTGRRVTRVEHLLARRERWVGELRARLNAVAAALGEALALPVHCGARLRRSPDPQKALANPRAVCLLHLDAPGVDILLELELRWVVGLVARLGGAPPPSTPVLALSQFERAVLGHLMLVALAGLRGDPSAENCWAPRLVGVVPWRQDAEAFLGQGRLLGVELELRAGERSGHGTLLVRESAVQGMLRAVEQDAPRPGCAGRTVRFGFRPRIRCGVLWPGELRGLRAGMALVLPGLRAVDGQVEGPVELWRAGRVLRGELGGARWSLGEITSTPLVTEVTCVDPQLSSLPVELEVELGSVPLTLAELSALAPGSVVPLRIAPGDPVFLRAGDRRLARAELVDLEGEVAARVLDLLE